MCGDCFSHLLFDPVRGCVSSLSQPLLALRAHVQAFLLWPESLLLKPRDDELALVLGESTVVLAAVNGVPGGLGGILRDFVD